MHVGYDFAALVAPVHAAWPRCSTIARRKIPNWLTVSAAVLGLAYHTFDTRQGIGPLAALAGFADRLFAASRAVAAWAAAAWAT